MPVWSANHWKQLSGLCAGFIFATVWFDMMFDSRVSSCCGDPSSCSSEEVSAHLSVISSYYKNVTVDAFPRGFLLGFVMLLGVVAAYESWKRSRLLRWLQPLTLVAVSVIAAGFAFSDCIALGQMGGSLEGFPKACNILNLHMLQLFILFGHIFIHLFAPTGSVVKRE